MLARMRSKLPQTHRLRRVRCLFASAAASAHEVKAPATSWLKARFNARLSISRSRLTPFQLSTHDAQAIASDRFSLLRSARVSWRTSG